MVNVTIYMGIYIYIYTHDVPMKNTHKISLISVAARAAPRQRRVLLCRLQEPHCFPAGTGEKIATFAAYQRQFLW